MRSFDSVYKVDGQPLLVPDAEVELHWSDLDSEAAGRDESGYMHRAVLRQGVRTWGFTYGVLTKAELSYLMDLFAGKATFTFQDGEDQTVAYCAKQEVRLYDRTHGVYKGMKFNIIEC